MGEMVSLGREVARRLRIAEKSARQLAEIRREYGEDAVVVGEGTPDCPFIIITRVPGAAEANADSR